MIKRILSLISAVLFIVFVLVGCGSSMTAAPASADMSDNQKNISNGEAAKSNSTDIALGYSGDESNAAFTASATSGTVSNQSTNANESTINAILAQRKIIRNADITLEVDNFDTAYAKIKSIIESFGYIQQSNIRKEKENVDFKEQLIKRGTIIVRVDMDRFDKVLDGINGLGDVLNINISTDDVTDKFYDVESQLRLLKYEQSRLEEYLNKITDPDTIFKTESRLTDIRHQIEGLTGTLNKLDDLVKLSTITINMSDKTSMSVTTKTKGYWQRLSDGFINSLKGVAVFLGGFILFITAALPIILLIGILAIIAIYFYKRYNKKDKSV